MNTEDAFFSLDQSDPLDSGLLEGDYTNDDETFGVSAEEMSNLITPLPISHMVTDFS